MVSLKAFRESNNLTQKEISDILNVSLSYYQKIEGGFKKPSFNFIQKCKEKFPEISVEIFFDKINH